MPKNDRWDVADESTKTRQVDYPEYDGAITDLASDLLLYVSDSLFDIRGGKASWLHKQFQSEAKASVPAKLFNAACFHNGWDHYRLEG